MDLMNSNFILITPDSLHPEKGDLGSNRHTLQGVEEKIGCSDFHSHFQIALIVVCVNLALLCVMLIVQINKHKSGTNGAGSTQYMY